MLTTQVPVLRAAVCALCLSATAMGAAWSAPWNAADPQPPLMNDPSLEELRQALSPVATSRSFRRTELPTTDGLCPGAGASVVSDKPRGGATGRNLEVVPMPSTDAPRVNLAVQFATGKDQITSEGQRLLDRVAQVLSEPGAASARFAIAGHADATGTDRVNLELSCARAIAVRGYLVKQGRVAPERLTAYGFGSNHPLEPGVKDSAANRRVEVRRVD